MMDENKFVHKKVNSIQFGILSPKMIKSMASAKVVTPELYDKEGYPVDGGLMDIRLGVIDPGLHCKTCGSKLKECVGHFGHIELARPVIHIKFVKMILILLRSCCRECGRAMLEESKVKQLRVEYEKVKKDQGVTGVRDYTKTIIAKIKSINKCPHCKEKQKKLALEKPSVFLEEEKRLSPIEIRSRLEKIQDDDLFLFNIDSQFFRPEWSVLTVLPVPPVTMRPSITLESGERSEDDLTHKLGDIVRINQRLFENINAGAPEIIVEDLWDLLQYHITTFFDNSVAQLPPARHRSGQPLKTLSARIKGKEGRIRHNLVGKRTNFSARTVISPDPMLDLDEVGVPKIIAMKLTVPEKLTEWNMEYFKKFVERGPKNYPGSNYVVRPDGKKKKITDETKEQLLEELQPGYVVERHLMDNDIAIFNRQPSLHRMSMMCHKVRVLPGRTFRLNPAVCAPYNADFDGDEMNLHIPQTPEAQAEALLLMQVQTQLISPRYGLSIIGCIQDSISGNYLLTKDMKFTRQEAIDLLLSIREEDLSKLPNKEEITGKEIFSAVIPNDFDFKGYAMGSTGDEKLDRKDDKLVIIKHGKLKEGIMDKANLGEGSGLLLRNLHKKYGPEETIKILGKVFRLGIEVLLKKGFSTAIYDTDLSNEAQEKIRQTLDEAYGEVDKIIAEYKEGQLDAFQGRTIAETLELKILEKLNKARNDTGKIVHNYAQRGTGVMVMADSGAKGGVINFAQMAGCVGQQAMRGKRIEKGYKNRTLSCFKRNDLSPAQHGFIRGSFKSGMGPSEFFFAAMTGRDSLMDTALRTPKSGYLYRRLSNAMQDLKVGYDGTVRDSTNSIVQFSYGEDGIDVSRSEDGMLNVKRIVDLVLEGE